MRLVSLELREWRAYEHCPIEFPDGLVGVGGPNGAGKSTIIEAIGWTLFGKLRPGATVGDLRRQGGSGRPTAELVFQLGDTTYTVRRVAGGDCTLWIGDTDGEPEASGATNVSRRIAQELDLTWDVFKRSVFAEQKDLAALDPKATGPARRAHVERLLGLSKFKRAADRARAEVKSVDNEIAGRVADLEDEQELATALSEAERVAEVESPRVGELKERLEAAEATYKTARGAVEKEHERTKQAAQLQERRDAAVRACDAASERRKDLARRLEERKAGEKRLAEIDPEAREAPSAQRALEALDSLAEATTDLESAQEELQGIEHDPDAQTRDEESLEALESEREGLRSTIATLAEEVAALEQRQIALADGASVGDPAERHAELDDAVAEERRLDREAAHLERRIEQDRKHVQAVREGGPASPCPVCRKPYGDQYEEILADHEAEIAAAEVELPELKAALETAAADRKSAQDRHAGAMEAAKALDRTTGPDTLRECEGLLDAKRARREREVQRLAEVDAELPPLRATIVGARQRAGRWAPARAVVDERRRHLARAADAAGCEAYDAELHEAARQRSVRLTALAAEADELLIKVAGARELETELASAESTVGAQQARASEIQTQLDELAVEEHCLEALQETCRTSEGARDTLRSELEEARLAAQRQSQAVGELQRRLEALRQALTEVKRRRLDLRRYQVAVDILEQYREHEAQRAWPQLQQGASALLVAASGGRYADIRLSTDYKLTIVDRGEEHGLARYSGGEQDLANLCLRLAIAEWVAKERGTDIGVVILDEVFGSQDEDRRRLLLDQLRALSARFRQMLIVTHLPDIADLCDSHIEVSIDDDGKSSAEVVA